LALLGTSLSVTGYVLGIFLLTPGYQLVQAANNTAALSDVPRERRGTVSGLLTLSRNIGLIAGASALGAVFAYGVGGEDLERASSTAIATGMRLTFLCAGGFDECRSSDRTWLFASNRRFSTSLVKRAFGNVARPLRGSSP
jgi:hypothetical protein